MSIEELADVVQQECQDQAEALLVILSVTRPELEVVIESGRTLLEAGIAAGIAATLETLERRGLLVEDVPS